MLNGVLGWTLQEHLSGKLLVEVPPGAHYGAALHLWLRLLSPCHLGLATRVAWLADRLPRLRAECGQMNYELPTFGTHSDYQL